MDLIRRIDWTGPRTFWQVSWMAAGAIVLLAGIIQGSLPFGAAVGTYFGFGAGIELTLFISGRRERGPQSAYIIGTEAKPPAAPAVVDETPLLLDAFQGLGFREKDARRLAAASSIDLPLVDRVRIGLAEHGRQT